MTDRRITMTDCRDAGYCARGVVERFERLGFPKYQIVKDGIPIADLTGVDDAQVTRVIAKAEERLRRLNT